MVGSKLGAYELREEIGRGGMGIVYRAVQSALGRIVAVKVLAPHLVADEEFVARFLREARAAANLEHPGIVTIYDVGRDGEVYFFAMQLLPGRTVEQLLRDQGRLTTEQVLSVGIQLADALHYAHQAGIYHRDVKPANILIDGGGRCVLTDFGIAWAASETRLTRAGTSLGSPDYMAPETVQGKPADGRSDIYSLGVLLFQGLTGTLPYSGDTPLAVAYQHINQPVPSVRSLKADVRPEVAAVIERLMAKQPGDRFATAAEVVQRLSQLSGGVMVALPGAEGVAAPTTPTPFRGLVSPDAPTARAPRRSVAGLGLALSLVGLALVVGLYLVFGRSGQETTAVSGGAAPVPVADQTPVAEPEQGVAQTRPEEPAVDPAPPPVQEAATDVPVAPPVENEVASGSPPAAEVEEEASPPPPEPVVVREPFTITSRPAGATVYLAGRRLDGSTPVEVELAPGESHEVRLELEGHRPTGLQFALEELPAQQRASGELHFPLVRLQPRGILLVRSGYPVQLRLADRTYDVAGGPQRLEVDAGTHEIEVLAPSVFLSVSRTIEVPANGEGVLELPPTVEVTIAATPSRCRIAIDGRDVDDAPLTLDLVMGRHVFGFDWQTIGVQRTVERLVAPNTRQVFLAANEDQ